MTSHVYGIFGGTFDPPHNGHIRALKYCADTLSLSRVGLMPANIPVFKSNTSAAKHRMHMLALACELDARFHLEDIEFRRQSASYTCNSLHALKQQDPSRTLVFIMGEDAFLSLHQWHNWQSLFDYAHIVVLARDQRNAADPDEFLTAQSSSEQLAAVLTQYFDPKVVDFLLLKSLASQNLAEKVNEHTFKHIITQSSAGKLLFVANPLINISSTNIRDAIKRGEDLSQYVPANIVEYIKQHSLYEAGEQ